MTSGEPDAHHINSLQSHSDGLEGMARLGGHKYAGAIARRSNFFGHSEWPNFPIWALGRSSSSPPISFIPSTSMRRVHRLSIRAPVRTEVIPELHGERRRLLHCT